MNTVLITGCSSGYGLETARYFLDRDWHVIATMRTPREDVLPPSPRLRVLPLDVTDPESIRRTVAAAGPIDVLVNNAGVQLVGRTVDAVVEDCERMLRLNVLSPFRLTKHVLPGMLARGKGTIVDIASMAAIAPTPGMFYYNASKAALAAASESLRGELRGSGVHVMTVYPGPVRTAMEATGRAAYVETAMMKLFTPTGEADVLARKIAKGVASGRARIIYPATYGVSRHFPNLTRFFLDRFTPPLKALPPGGAKA
jgi:short-subunit dehydrogenase